MRAGLVAGAAAFIACAIVANSFVLKIEVGGSGSLGGYIGFFQFL